MVVWHDEEILGTKCRDTAPVVSMSAIQASGLGLTTRQKVFDDPAFPYAGKYIANLTLAQLKTLDCGSQRQDNFRTCASGFLKHL